MDHDRNPKVVLLRDYTRTMAQRIESLRGRASGDGASQALAEAFQELEITREELTVADEEMSSAEARYTEALRALEARACHYAELFEGAPDGYVLTSALGIVREGNRTFSMMMGMPKSFVEGKPLVNFVARGDVRRFRDELAALLREDAGATTSPGPLTLRMRPRDGQSLFVAEVQRSVVRGVGDSVSSIRWTVRRAPARREPHEIEPEEPPSDGSEALD